MKTQKQRRRLIRSLALTLTLLAVLIPSVSTLAADGDIKANHGAVKVYNYDYDNLVRRLTTKYPGVFKTATVYDSSGQSVGTAPALRALMSNSTNHRQSGNSGTTVKFINGSSRSTSNWAQALGNFESKEYFMVNGHVGYCFDWTTPSTSGSHSLSGSLSAAGINVGTGANVLELAQAAKMLTQNNYALIAQNAGSIARALSIPAYTDPDRPAVSQPAVTIAKADVEALLRDTTADGIAFKRALVQMLVWGKMNALSFRDWLYSFGDTSGFYNKEGQWIEGTPIISAPIIGYSSIINFDTMYSVGRNAWVQMTSGSQADYQYQYELKVGVPFTVPAADVANIVKIAEANGGKIESGGSVTVAISANKQSVTLTATRAIPDWTGWLGTSESSNMIYSSKPYNPSYYSGSTLVMGSGQFIVDVSEMVYMRARVKAVQPTGTVKITKSSANPTISNGNPCYSLAGAKYGVYTTSACQTLAKDSSGANAVLTTAANGTSNTLTLNAGNYWIKEISPSPGYGVTTGTYAITVTDGGNLSFSGANSAIFKEPPLNDPLSIEIQKTAATNYSGAAFDMSGAQYTIKYYAGQYTKANLPSAPTATWVIETKKVGNAYRAVLGDGYVISGTAVYGKNADGRYSIPLGTITIQETKAPKGFKIEGSTLQLAGGSGADASDGVVLYNIVDQNSAVRVISGNVTDDTKDGVQILQKETVASVNVKLVKTSDDGNVSGISFTLSGTLTAGGTYSVTKTTDAKGAIDFGEVPFGSYKMTEDLTAAQAKTYLPNAPVSFTLNEQTKSPYTVTFHNTVKRGSLTFTKTLEETGSSLANIPFKLTNTTTNEAHYFITDGSGVFDSERGRHSAGTNGADAVLSGYVPDTDVVPDSAVSTLVSAGAADYGVWFGKDPVTDAKKALPVGTYLLEEMKTERTKTFVMRTLTFEVTEEGQTIALGTVTNHELTIGTTALDAKTGTHNAFAGTDTTIIDTVSYAGAEAGKSYTVNGELMLIEPDGTAAPLGVTASVSFTAAAESGTVDLTFTFDASGLAGRKIVVFETLLTETGQFAAEHKDPADENQIISLPKILTSAKDSESGTGVSMSDNSVTIIDTVTYTGLIPGREYTLKGELMVKRTGSSMGVTAEKTFTPETADGSTDLTFTFAPGMYGGQALVAYESLYLDTELVAEHKDINDDAQTVYLPQIGTKLENSGAGTVKYAEATGKITLTDTIAYRNIRPGQTYLVKGELLDKATGRSLGIKAEKSFTPETPDGTVDMTFTFDGEKINGKVVVAFETIYCNGAVIAAHSDIDDPAQTVYIPRISTTATAQDTEAHVTGPNEQVVITDRVDYTGLEPGKTYTVKGELYDKESGKSMGITAEKTFTAEAPDGYIELTFTVDARLLTGKTIVTFETLYYEGVEIAVHHDIHDEGQSVHIPEIETDAADAESGLDHVEADEKAQVTDVITYRNLVPGREYTVKGELYDKATGESIGVTAEAAFTPETADGKTTLTFSFDASELSGRALVAFERLYYKGVEIAVHSDIDDERQTVYVPGITTDAKNDATGTHEGTIASSVTITDTVTYTGLVPGREYTVKGLLMDREANAPLLIDGKEITAEAVFTPETADGTVDLTFTFSSLALNGKTVVVFETLYHEGVEVAVHADITDDNQAVVYPGLRTNACDAETGNRRITSDRVKDHITYTGITPGSKYVVITRIYDKRTSALLDAGAETYFTPETPDGALDVTINVDTTGLAFHDLVVFEKLYLVKDGKRILVGVHEDPTDKAQTVSVPGFFPKTGDPVKLILPIAAFALSGTALACLFLRRRNKRKEEGTK